MVNISLEPKATYIPAKIEFNKRAAVYLSVRNI
jgi:hypothetical protein